MGYAEIDPGIRRWADRNLLFLYTSSGGYELRNIYVSSEAGECFQIWIDYPIFGLVLVHAATVEYIRTDPSFAHWLTATSMVEKTLEDALQAVISWMAPAERHIPKRRER